MYSYLRIPIKPFECMNKTIIAYLRQNYNVTDSESLELSIKYVKSLVQENRALHVFCRGTNLKTKII